jgi:hypothetical protein
MFDSDQAQINSVISVKDKTRYSYIYYCRWYEVRWDEVRLFEVRGTRYEVRSSCLRCEVRGARCEVGGPRCEVRGPGCEVRGTRVRGTRYEVWDTRYEIRGTRTRCEIQNSQCKIHCNRSTRCEVQGLRYSCTECLISFCDRYQQSPNFLTFKEPRNLFQGIKSASLCSLGGRYDNPVPIRFLAPFDCLKILAQYV